MNRGNFDYAAQMFQQAARLSPENVLYHQLARGAAKKSYKDNGSGASSMKKMKIGGLKSKAKKAKGKEQYSEAATSLEEALLLNPWDVSCNYELAEVARAAGWMEVAKFAMTSARNDDQQNIDLNIALAELLDEMEHYKEAGQIYEFLASLDPNNGHYRSMAQRSFTKQATKDAKLEDVDTATDAKKELTPQQISERLKTGSGGPADGPGMDQRADLERATRKEPESVEAWQKLGAFLKKAKDYPAALDAFSKAEELAPDEHSIREQKEDVEIEILKIKLSEARESGDDEAIKSAATTLIKREMQVLETRVVRYPQDLNLKYELGARFLKTGAAKLIPKAIPLLQRAAQSPQHKGKALVMLGQCFIKEKKPSLAKGQLERAIPELHPDNDAGMVIESHYLLGRIYEQLDNAELAEKHYGDVLVLDYDYKDAKDRLEAMQSA